MNIYEVFFILQFLIVIGIVLLELYNVMRVSTLYTLRIDFLLFIVFFISYLMGFIITMLNPTEYIYFLLLRVENIFIILNVLFFISSLLLKLSYLVKDANKGVKPYNSMKERKREYSRTY